MKVKLTVKFSSYPKPIHFEGELQENDTPNGVMIEEKDGTKRVINVNNAEWWTFKEIPLEEQRS